MAILKPRTRMVYFRLSEEEFREFTALCELQGARSLSDLARCALQELLHKGAPSADDHVTARLDVLERAVTEMNGLLRTLCAAGVDGSVDVSETRNEYSRNECS